MTVLDTSAVVDYLMGVGVSDQVDSLIRVEGELAAPDVMVFEVVAAIRRQTLAGGLDNRRATAAIEDLADLPIEIFPSMPLRSRAFQLGRNLTVADGLFAALAEELGEPIATKDVPMARAITKHCNASVVVMNPA